jgi:predicted TIM-barrel fold metal-dependent hydrolase
MLFVGLLHRRGRVQQADLWVKVSRGRENCDSSEKSIRAPVMPQQPHATIVDTHVHLLPERLSAAIRRFFPENVAGAMIYPYEFRAARASIVAAGVRRCWSLPYVRRRGTASALNRWMAETFAGDPVVVPGATVHPEDDVERVLDEALNELRLHIIKLHCSVGNFDPDDARLDPLWRRASRTGHPVVLHAGHAVNGSTSDADIAPVRRVARRWPDARIIVAHCGAPAVEATLDLLRGTRSTYADLTPVVLSHASIRRSAIGGLERRLLFGSDAPNVAIRIEDSVAQVLELGLAAADEAAILSDTAERLLVGAGI